MTNKGDIGDGMLDVFDRYNFTVKEDEPLEKEVAVDPEMLGKVFENLLEIKNRKSKGTYYTPREIVHYMCQESLIEYLYGEFNRGIVAYEKIGGQQIAMFGNESKKAQLDLTIEHRQQSLIDKKDIKTLIRYGESVVEHEHHVVNKGQETDRYSFKLPERIRANALRIDEKLAGVRVCDPAVGSGAFVVGMMNEIVRARNALTPHINENKKRTSYDFKRHAIQHCLYGVDVDSGAIEIAKLRLWLSLVVDEEERDSIQPLPNLDYKIVCGNSLLGINKFFNHESLKKLEALKPLHFNETSAVKKQKYKQQIDDLISQITDGHKDFDFDAYFSEVFHEKNGFDVTIGNPPYVALQKNNGELGRLYRNAGFTTFASTGDVCQLFYEKAVHLLKQDTGHACFISSNQWMRIDSGEFLRKFIESQNPIRLINLGAGVFDNVTVNTCILLVNRSANQNVLQAADLRQATQQFPPDEWTHIRPAKGKTWVVLANTGQGIKEKMETIGTPLKEWNVTINYGIKTGYNDAFIIDDTTKRALIAADPKSAKIIKPVLRGRDIQRYQADWARLWLIDIHNGYGNIPALNIDDYPAIKNHLDGFYPQLKKRQDKGKTPYNLRNCAYHEEFAKEKIVWGNLCNQAKFSYAQQDMLVIAPCPFLTPFNHYLLAVLNSKLLDWYFRLIGVERDGGYFEYKPMFIERLPIPKLSPTEQRPFIRLVDRILEAKARPTPRHGATNPKTDTSEQEAKIDRLVYELYQLTPEEIAIIEKQK